MIFNGHFVNNRKNGYGILIYGNGDQYKGDFSNDKLEGNGEYHFNNGDIWEGVFHNNMKNGIGIMIKKSGELFLTQYENDNFIGEVELNNEEKNFIENLRQKDKKKFYEQKKMNETGRQNLINQNNNSSKAVSDLYIKKRNLTASIKVYK